MKRYGSRRNDNEYGNRSPVHGAKSSRARAKRLDCEHHNVAEIAEHWCADCGTPMTRIDSDYYIPCDSGAIPDQEQE